MIPLLAVLLVCMSMCISSALESNGIGLDLEKYVNVLGGTESRYDLSTGNTLPLIQLPWGFNGYSIQSNDDPTFKGWWFHPDDRRFFGLRVTHQPSPWIEDYGNFLISPSVLFDDVFASSIKDNSNNNNDNIKKKKTTIPSSDGNQLIQFTGYSTKSPHSLFSPSYFKTSLYGYSTSIENTILEFSPTSHGGIMKVQFPSFDSSISSLQTRRIAFVLNGNDDYSSVEYKKLSNDEKETVMVSGYTKVNSGGVGDENSDFSHFFVAFVYRGLKGNEPSTFLHSGASKDGAYVDFDGTSPLNDLLTVRFATSFISIDQAIANLQQEVDSSKSFDEVRKSARDAWQAVLGRVKVEEVSKDYSASEAEGFFSTFYSCMYRASLFPRLLTEVAADGSLMHWSPYAKSSNTRVMPGHLSADSGFWDAYSTVYPGLSLWNRPMLTNLINGWINAYKEGSWLPKWSSPGYRSGMVGTMGDVTLADAIVKEIPGFDVSIAYEAIRKDAFEIPPNGVEGVGRVCLESYLQFGYIPKGAPITTGGSCYEIVSRTLNYMQSDFAIAKAAAKLGKGADERLLSQRAYNYSLLFDAETGFFRSKDSHTDRFVSPFDQYAWGNDYTEAGPWQYRFYVPFDALGLSQLYKQHGLVLCDILEDAQTSLSTYHRGDYASEIHEEIELRDHCWGQYSHNNQPVHHMLYMFIASDPEGYSGACAKKGQKYIRQAVTSLYKSTNDMFAGDEDNGQMSSWYLLSSIGLYALAPGTEDYIVSSPLFDRVIIDISDNTQEAKTLEILAVNNGKANVYVDSVTFNGRPIGLNSVPYSELMKGGKLVFTMKGQP